MMFGLGMPGIWELVVLFLIILLLFGGQKVPEIAKAIGKGMREFKRAMNDLQNDDKDDSGS